MPSLRGREEGLAAGGRGGGAEGETSELELVDGRGAATSAGVVCPASCDELGLDVTSRLYQTRANVHTDVGVRERSNPVYFQAFPAP